MIDGKDYVILTKSEYKKLADPDKRYAMMTVSKAKKIKSKILKAYDFECIHDRDNVNSSDWCCDYMCPLSLFGIEAIDGLCDKTKYWSK